MCVSVVCDSSVMCCTRFLERQLLAQRAEWEQEKLVLTQQLQDAYARDAPVSKELQVKYPYQLLLTASLLQLFSASSCLI